jgi:hypothetical protein
MSSLGEGIQHKGPAEVTSHRGAAYKLRPVGGRTPIL